MPSSFPTGIDVFLEVQPGDEIVAQHQNERGDAITALETALGTNPQGAFGTVRERLDGAHVGQGQLKTADLEVSSATSTLVDLSTAAGFGFFPQLKKSENTNVIMTFAGFSGNDIPIGTTYRERVYMWNSSGTGTMSAKVKYVTASSKTFWHFLLTAAKDFTYTYPNGMQREFKKGEIIQAYACPDHPSCNRNDVAVEHPFDDYDPALHTVVLANEAQAKEVIAQVNRKQSFLDIANKKFEVDFQSTPAYRAREIFQIDEFGDLPGQAIGHLQGGMKVKVRNVANLPESVQYRSLKVKKP